ncbi:DUF3467 domain-containing protein [Ramlibacter sp. USB13]|uniref:DUF3467 domain-containing protein n=1 Tax=Ramlibacter cellulosilyticus TaxID=2764187 RepID=A0A923MRJ1_9BURK|nr:DUF3467 domain-containing protein [Ramlibacter cellulosilyticus]MBC5784502.1 DUF3467 domain-containing protein [Ramlibacter cellulosilyticus]
MPPLDPPRARTALPPPAPQAAAEPAAYANHFEVGFNAFEFLLDFAQAYESAEGLALAHTRIVTAPAYAKVFRALLDRSIVEYEAAFGPITPAPPEDP